MLTSIASFVLPSGSCASDGEDARLTHRYPSLSATTFVAIHPPGAAMHSDRRGSEGSVPATGTEHAWIAVRPSPPITGPWAASDLDELAHLAQTTADWVSSAEAAFKSGDSDQASTTTKGADCTLAERKTRVARFDTAERWDYDPSREPMYAFTLTDRIEVEPALGRITQCDRPPVLRVEVAVRQRESGSRPTAADVHEWILTFHSNVAVSVLTAVNAPIGQAIADIARRARMIAFNSEAELTVENFIEELNSFVTRRQTAAHSTVRWRDVDITLQESTTRLITVQSHPICGLLFDFPVLLGRSVVMTGKMLFFPSHSTRRRSATGRATGVAP